MSSCDQLEGRWRWRHITQFSCATMPVFQQRRQCCASGRRGCFDEPHIPDRIFHESIGERASRKHVAQCCLHYRPVKENISLCRAVLGVGQGYSVDAGENWTGDGWFQGAHLPPACAPQSLQKRLLPKPVGSTMKTSFPLRKSCSALLLFLLMQNATQF